MTAGVNTKPIVTTAFLAVVHILVFVLLVVLMRPHLTTGDLTRTIAALAVVTALSHGLYSSSKRACALGHVIVAVLCIYLSCCICYQFKLYVSDGPQYSLAYPSLANDDARYYQLMLHYLDPSQPSVDARFTTIPVEYPGLSWVAMLLCKVLGTSVVWIIALNMLMNVTGMIAVGSLTARLVGGTSREQRRWALLGMGMACTLLYMLWMTARVLKEPASCFGLTLTGYALAGLSRQCRFTWRDSVAFVLGCLILAIFRTTMLYFVGIALAVMAIDKWRATRQWRTAAVLALVVVALFVAGNQFSLHTVDMHKHMATGGRMMQDDFMTTAAQQPYLRLIGPYFYFSYWKRALYLPVTLTVQFLIPFPWGGHGLYESLRRFQWGWYAIGGLSMFYFLFIAWRRREGIGAWAWWPLLAMVILAYLSAGSVSRYAGIFEAMMIPMAVSTIATVSRGKHRRALLWWCIGFVIVLALLLGGCYWYTHR